MTKPDWASDIGKDSYGVYADLVFKDVTQRFRWIPPGKFMMGSSEDKPDRKDDEHQVEITEGYWLADTACSQAFYLAVMDENTSHFKGEELPVEHISWKDAQAFTQRLNERLGTNTFRLPSEAEWEYACRAGTSTAFAYGDEIDESLTNFGQNSNGTVPVDSLYRNAWGLVQMHGNVREWCSDWYAPYDTIENIVFNPQGLNGGDWCVLRGGSWFDLAQYCRSAYRSHYRPENRLNLGFRLAARRLT